MFVRQSNVELRFFHVGVQNHVITIARVNGFRNSCIAAVTLVAASNRELFPNYHRASDVTSHESTLHYGTDKRRISSRAVALYLQEKINCLT